MPIHAERTSGKTHDAARGGDIGSNIRGGKTSRITWSTSSVKAVVIAPSTRAGSERQVHRDH